MHRVNIKEKMKVLKDVAEIIEHCTFTEMHDLEARNPGYG
jgi:hypothetical protein